MERRAIVEILTGQQLDPLNMLRRQFRMELNDHAAIFQFQIQGVFEIEVRHEVFHHEGYGERRSAEPGLFNIRGNTH